MKLDEIAARINAHLKRFETDPVINAVVKQDGMRLTPYYWCNVWRAGSKLGLRYIAYQGDSFLTKTEALAYLAWLDAGNIGKHYGMCAESPKSRPASE